MRYVETRTNTTYFSLSVYIHTRIHTHINLDVYTQTVNESSGFLHALRGDQRDVSLALYVSMNAYIYTHIYVYAYT